MTALKIVYVPLDDVAPYDKNPKRHDVDLIVGSIRRFGMMDPVVICGRADVLVGGHGRLKALAAYRDLHAADPETWPFPDGIRRRGSTWLVPQVSGWSSANDVELEAAIVTLNRATEVGGWDDAALLDILQAQVDQPHGIEGLGYSTDALDQLRSRVEADDPDADLTEDDQVDVSLPAVAHTQPGDAWRIPRPSRSTEHPTMKPIELVGKSIINSTVGGELIVDPFAGSGTTLLAAARTGRAGAGIELDCGYVDVIVRRLVAETGTVAVHADTGAEFPHP